MPELPEVETTCQGIKPYLVGKKIKKVNVFHKKLRWPISKELAKLNDEKVISVSRRGKYILINTAKGSIIIHLGMSGYLQLVDVKTPLKKHDHVEFELQNRVNLRLNDTRRFGAVLWAKNPLQHSLLKSLGPEPLTREFSANYLHKKITSIRRAIKLTIMDSQIVVGVGNIYANEALFLAKINPNREAQTLTVEECKALVTSIKKVLRKAIKSGGTTLKDFQNVEGKPGYFSQSLNVYGRLSEYCYDCGTPLSSSRLGQRITLWCHQCQI